MDWGFILERTVSTVFGVEVLVFALAAVGLNVQFGYAGLLNFGQVGFMAAGAYGLGVSMSYFQWNFAVGVAFGIIYSIILALILGVPTLRLRADYLAIVTIAASETIRLLVRWRRMKSITGASEGIGEFTDSFYESSLNPFTVGKRYEFGPFSYVGRDLWILLVGWTILIITVLLVKRLMGSPWGRALKAIREDEDAARALGKNAYMYKLQALTLGGVIGGMAGMMQVLQKGSIQADTFNPVITFTIWAILILGGPGRTWSPIIGSMIYWGLVSFLENVLRGLPEGPADTLEDTIGLSDLNVSQVRFILVGLGLVLLARFRPQGIFGSREEMALDDR